ncbi:hypothetical protein C7974DRAFT_317958, partial [Boeremia exigua]|uniref:uncharacterized protein n=1 Tax=Boeremia exigua TaxID=749465 RepID=UPI001E8EB339
STLPLTFQEAVVFTQWLGVRYLWIDALCIIQEDEVDWSREAIAIYSHIFTSIHQY